MNKIKSIKLICAMRFRPGAGTDSSVDKLFPIENVLKTDVIYFEYFYIKFTHKSQIKLEGSITWQHDNLQLYAGSFYLDFQKANFSTPFLNVAYDTHYALIIEILF